MDLANEFLQDLESDEEGEESLTPSEENEKHHSDASHPNPNVSPKQHTPSPTTGHRPSFSKTSPASQEQPANQKRRTTPQHPDHHGDSSSSLLEKPAAEQQEKDASSLLAVAPMTISAEAEKARALMKAEQEDGESAALLVKGLSSTLGGIRAYEEAGPQSRDQMLGSATDDEESQLLVQCNALGAEIQVAQRACVQHVRKTYARRFPDLEALVPESSEYVRVVRATYESESMEEAPLREVLPPSTVLVVLTAAAQRPLPALNEDEKTLVRHYCDRFLWLAQSHQRILDYVERRMGLGAPNLSALCGKAIAARLVAAAGGLKALSRLPSSSLQLLGATHRALGGLSSKEHGTRRGFIYEAEVVANSPPSLRARAVRLLAGKCALAARVDMYRESAEGNVGATYREDIENTIRKLDAPSAHRTIKARPLPDAHLQKKRRRGGRRYRKQREKMAVTEMARQHSRRAFGEDAGDDEELTIVSGGRLAASRPGIGIGKVRVAVRTTGLAQLSQKRKKQLAAQSGQSRGTHGLASSLAFTPVQGLELEDPSAKAARELKLQEANSQYFSETGGFSFSKATAQKNSNLLTKRKATTKAPSNGQVGNFKVPSKRAKS